jgi:hypothetical protein
LPDQKQPPDFKIACKSCIHAIAVRFKSGPRGIERFCRPAQVTRRKGNLGLGDHASGTGHGLFRRKSTRRPPQEFLRSREIAKLRHRDAAKRECRRIVAQRDALQGSEGIASCEGTSCSCNQRVHPNPATLVTPTSSMTRGKYSAWQLNSSSEEVHMCPACIESTAVMVAGAVSSGGFLAICIGRFRRVLRVSGLALFQKTKEK